MKTPKEIEVVTHFWTNDPGCNSDYARIELLIDDELAIEYQDDYHDKGQEKIDGFIEGLRWVFDDNLPKIKHTNVADEEC